MNIWNTRVTCESCGEEIPIEGSYNRVFGQPKPR